MAELIEYSLVVMASTLLIAGSFQVYGNFSSFEARLSLEPTFDAVSALASKAVDNGSARGTISLPAATIACHNGVLSVTVGSSSKSESLPVSCEFVTAVPGGVSNLKFRADSSQLYLTVT